VALASSTPWASPVGGASTEAETDGLHLVTPSAVNRDAFGRVLHQLPAPLRSARCWLVLSDIVVAVAVLAVAGRQPASSAIGPMLGVLLVVAWCTALGASGAWTHPVRSANPRAVLRAGVCAGLGCWMVDATIDPAVTSAQLLGVTMALAAAALLPRLALGLVVRAGHPVRVALAGDGDDVRRLLSELDRGPREQWLVSAVCVDADDAVGLAAAREYGVPTWCGVEDVVTAAFSTGASAVLLAPGRRLCPATARQLSWRAHAADLDVFLGTGLLDVDATRATLVPAGDLGLVHLRPTTRPSFTRLVKTATERLLAALALLAFLPLLIAIVVAIRIDTRGGSLFRQTRVGRDGRPFTMYKFRTMATDAETRRDSLADVNESDGLLFKIRQDPRITRVGAVLRRYSLDELPQLLNVVRGQMSLVGPRPALPQEVERYGIDPQHRLVVRPGLTGLWQVSGRSDLSWEESVRLDLHYVDNWSLAMDVQIVLRTVRAVLSHRGAY
jgi:exopolysaccharide biosynthesis polyprenyl glycosylphosphotransferase